MKLIFVVVGALLFSAVTHLIVGVGLLSIVAGIVGGFCGSFFFGFVKYRKYTPIELLDFHGIDSQLSRTNSIGELNVFAETIDNGGLLLDADPTLGVIQVPSDHWKQLSRDEKIALCQIMQRWCKLAKNKDLLTVEDGAGNYLGGYCCYEKLGEGVFADGENEFTVVGTKVDPAYQ